MRYPRRSDILKSIKNRLAEHQQQSNNINQESRASIYVSSLPLKDEIYAIVEKQFCQFIRTHYGWDLAHLPEIYV